MKLSSPLSALALLAALFLPGSGNASISGINATPTSNATIRFGDGPSFNGGGFNGGTYSPAVANPWNGALYSLPYTLDFTTLDDAQGSIVASFTPTTYNLNIPLAFIQQAVGNTGSAILQYGAVVEFQTDAFGFPTGPTQFPGFIINGTVQPAGFADFTGSITYTSAFWGTIDTVNYLYNNIIPGPFNATVSGVPSFGTTPVLPAFDTLTLVATFTFTVDPASITATTIPEPSASLLAFLSLPLLLARRRSLGAIRF